MGHERPAPVELTFRVWWGPCLSLSVVFVQLTPMLLGVWMLLFIFHFMEE